MAMTSSRRAVSRCCLEREGIQGQVGRDGEHSRPADRTKSYNFGPVAVPAPIYSLRRSEVVTFRGTRCTFAANGSAVSIPCSSGSD
jgi:hypothetical protein